MTILYAHSADAPPESGLWHPLDQHLQAVAELAAGFGAKFGAGDMCHALGLTHDLGKANPAFQTYLRDSASGRPTQSAPHAAPSAVACQSLLGPLVLAVIGHHAGLGDSSHVKASMEHANAQAVESARELLARLTADTPIRAPLPDWCRRDALAAEMFVRMCFSALVDADYLDTERHFAPSTTILRSSFPSLSWYLDELTEHMASVARGADSTHVNRARAEILSCCEASAPQAPGVFRLTVPTGGGKTLAGLSFALRHAVAHAMERVIFAIPYTSIIDQTASVYAGIFGEGNLLEHHSAMDVEETSEGQSPREARRRLAAENWDCPLVVTTTVQLFESLFANKPSRCRKLHNIARSVIVLDEVQALPPNLIEPILDGLAQLVRHYGCTIVFCTATQPDYSSLPAYLSLISNATEIVADPTRYFTSLKRVDFESISEPLSHEGLAQEIDAKESVLCVLNTRRDAVETLRCCRPGDDLFHLSTLMCPHHRKRKLVEVRQRLQNRQPVRLVSTQVVEAGVDLDFPVAMRDIGPLDRIVQVAGRCNREGKLDGRGRCILFRLDSGRAPQGAYKTGMDLTATLIESGVEHLDAPPMIATYFRDLFSHTQTDRIRVDGRDRSVQDLRKNFWFATLGERFRLIADDTIPVVVRNYAPAEIDALLSEGRYRTGRAWMRRLMPYMVSVRRYEFDRMRADALVATDETGIHIYTGAYSDVFGIGAGDERDPADLIVSG